MSVIDKLKELLGSNRAAESLSDDEVDMRVAVTVILITVAEADMEFRLEELEAIMQMLGKQYHLDESQVTLLMNMAEESRGRVSDLWPFTTALSRTMTPSQKLELLVMVWQVVFADGRLDPYEDQLLHRLQHMISVNHSVLMEAKRMARDKMGMV